MKMANRLSAVLPAVHHKTVSLVVESLALGNAGSRQHQGTHFRGVIPGQFRQAADVSPGDDQDMGGRFRVDVPESQDVFIVVNFRAWYLSLGNRAEQT